ncbi:MAG TPA: hypothetical protein VF756_27930 [Thermoanaerobaculia bacterium]
MRKTGILTWGTRQAGTLRAAVAALALAAALAGCVRMGAPHFSSLRQTQAPAPPSASSRAKPPRDTPERRLRYLDLSYGQMRRFENPIRLDEERLSYGALSAAALAAAGRPTRMDAARWTAALLDECNGRWNKVGCERALLSLQRIALQYPKVLSPELLARLRVEAIQHTPPPGPEVVRNPWAFKETENQRVIRFARNLAALKLDPGAPGSPRRAAAKAWGEAAAAFLLAHDRDGWYEAESPGYIGTSMTGLLHLADHAPQEEVRRLAERQLSLLFADWAQKQVSGFPAGPKSRTYVHWALGTRNTRWLAWAWLAAGLGQPGKISFMDWPEIATSGYRIPEPVARLLAERHKQPPYEIRARRRIGLSERQDLDTAVYLYATPDYILGASQAVGGLRLSVSGGQEIMATLFAEGPEFAPLYLWSRTQNPRSERWQSRAGQDLAMGHRNVVLARLGVGEGEATIGHAYLAPPWSKPEVVGPAVVVSRYGDTYVALVTAGGWEVAPAPDRFPAYYAGDRAFRGSWAAVPRVQPASIALEVGRRAEHGDFSRWKKRIASSRLTVAPGTESRAREMRFTASDGTRLAFAPGERALVADRPLVVDYPLLSAPFLSSPGEGKWNFSFDGQQYRLEAPGPRPAP